MLKSFAYVELFKAFNYWEVIIL